MTMRDNGAVEGYARPSNTEWVTLCDAAGNPQATYSPLLRLLIIKGRHGKSLHDLRKLENTYCENSTIVLG